MITKTLNSGLMPRCKLVYEDFEGFLTSYCYTYQHLKDSPLKSEREKYQRLLSLLNRIARRYGVQLPEEALANIRTEKPEWKPQKMKHPGALKKVADFYRIFHIDPLYQSNENDIIQLHEFVRTSV